MRAASIGAAAWAVVLLFVACGGDPQNPPRGGAFPPGPTAVVPIQKALCTPARASEDLSARADLTDLGMMPGQAHSVKISLEELYARFDANCGSCHGKSMASGNKQLHDVMDMARSFDASWLVRVKSDDPAQYMPPAPAGKPFSKRDATDPVAVFVSYAEAWIAQGRPADGFTVEEADGGGGSYAFSPDMAKSMTNLGTCVPNAAAVGLAGEAMMKSMDAVFAAAEALPHSLAETDLTTFDSEALAAAGVVAYVPTYPLWSGGSGKLRHIRVPRGTSVVFDKATQTFRIPENTRFYKTFFRKVVDRTGAIRNRKIETRVILTRDDEINADGVAKVRALFGTYKWSEDESTATLVTLPYRDGTPFADQHFPYVADEPRYEEIVNSLPPGGDFQVRLDEALAAEPAVVQHYAIPGRVRCEQCHSGSITKDFALGFIPLQLARRANKTGGTYEPTGDDELNQLQRFIDYGLITGMKSPAEVLPLEQSQGTRKPRTPEELTAQAYFLGNCAHCHNPRGFPSISKPPLAEALNFMPDGHAGGIFEFSLTAMSPIRFRGANNQVPVPYITPSLHDYPVSSDGVDRDDNGKTFLASPGAEVTWSPKYMNATGVTCKTVNPTTQAYCKDQNDTGIILAPWRSLIYRNVDTPFPYIDDFVPFPHMPMNTASFDCRAPRIVGEWMVSVPAKRKSTLPETFDINVSDTQKLDKEPQPYAEVKPGDEGFAEAQKAASDRLKSYKDSLRYKYCENDLGSDIFDPIGIPVSQRGLPNPPFVPYTSFFDGTEQAPPDPRDPRRNLPQIGVPYHSHWFDYDPSDAPPPWSPRRPNWEKLLPPGSPPDKEAPPGLIVDDALAGDRSRMLEAINATRLGPEVVAFANGEIPYALWDVKSGCEAPLLAAGAKRVADYPAEQRLTWMKGGAGPTSAPADLNAATVPPVASTALVYTTSPGETLYRHICFNCHGPQADGRGLQADALAAASEGHTRPANFREGLFGPSSAPGQNLTDVFKVPGSSETPQTWAARYMAWMGLGGTNATIPPSIVRQVQATPIFGLSREGLDLLPAGLAKGSANMLQLARGICSLFAPRPSVHAGAEDPNTFDFPDTYAFTENGQTPDWAYPPYLDKRFPLLHANADAEMWRHICLDYSPWLVRVYQEVSDARSTHAELTAIYRAGDPFATSPGHDAPYPADKPLLDHEKKVQYTADPTKNFYAACFKGPFAAFPAGATIRSYPVCDEGFLAHTDQIVWSKNIVKGSLIPALDVRALDVWTGRGAAVAGMSVFSYLRAGGAQKAIRPYYNECQLVGKKN